MSKIAGRIISCPRCRKSTVYGEENEFRPFCSKLCKLQDIGAWAYEEYKIPGPAAEEGDFPPPEDEQE